MSKKKPKTFYLKVKDHSVSSEEFELHISNHFEVLETVPQPSLDKLPDYYKSDDYISHTDGKRNFFEYVYHGIKKIALNRKVSLINTLSLDGKELLDMGCGTGDFLKTAATAGWKICGIEPDPKAREIANSKTGNAVHNSDHLKQIKPASFDVITLWHVLEHLPDYYTSVETLNSLLKPGGYLIIAVPNYKSYDALYYKEKWAAFDVPRHLWHFSKKSIEELSRQLNLELIEVLPMKFDAYYVSLLSEKYKSGKMNFLKGMFTGWRSNQSARRNGEYSSLIYVLRRGTTQF